jgi:hypothetical protein
LAEQLRKHGFDVVTSQEAGKLTATDDEQFDYAIADRRAILTFNVHDFALLHERSIAESREHWGIIFSTSESLGVLLRRLVRLLNTVSTEELRNQTRWLNEFK